MPETERLNMFPTTGPLTKNRRFSAVSSWATPSSSASFPDFETQLKVDSETVECRLDEKPGFQNVGIYSRQRSRCMAVFFAFRNPNPSTMTTAGKFTSISNGCRTDGKSKKRLAYFHAHGQHLQKRPEETGLGQIETLDYQDKDVTHSLRPIIRGTSNSILH